MAEYLAQRIKDGALDYDVIVSSETYKQYKEEIDAFLNKENN